MRHSLIVIISVLVCGYATAADKYALEPRSGLPALAPGELKIEIHSPSSDLLSTSPEISVEVEGVASTIGGVRFLDMILVLDASGSLRKTDPNDFRSMGAIELVRSLPPKSDMQIGVVGFDTDRNHFILGTYK